jgi:hypothetical protein
VLSVADRDCESGRSGSRLISLVWISIGLCTKAVILLVLDSEADWRLNFANMSCIQAEPETDIMASSVERSCRNLTRSIQPTRTASARGRSFECALGNYMGDALAEEQSLLFDNRLIERHVGTIISDPAVAILELVSNGCDPWTTEVDITWPERGVGALFVISDNGGG